MKKSLLTVAFALGFAGAVQADPIYIDVGYDYATGLPAGIADADNANTAAGDGTTGWLEQLSYIYESESVITDLDGSGGLSAGDLITTNGGFSDIASLSDNIIDGFTPNSSAGGPSDNLYGFPFVGWNLTFTISELSGTVSADGSLNYTSGEITFFFGEQTATDASEYVELFTLDVTGSGASAATGPFLTAEVSDLGTGSVNGVNAGDVFNTEFGSFEDYLALGQDIAIYSFIDYNTEPGAGSFLGLDDNGFAQFEIGGQHDGSIAFSVPEPTSLAVFSLGLLGLAASARKKAQK